MSKIAIRRLASNKVTTRIKKTFNKMEVAENHSIAVAKMRGKYFISVKEIAPKCKISTDLVYYLLRNGKINGAYRVSGVWLIPFGWRYKRHRRKKIKTNPLALQDPSKM